MVAWSMRTVCRTHHFTVGMADGGGLACLMAGIATK